MLANTPGSGQGSTCPNSDRWPQLLAGLLETPTAEAMLAHAGRCALCGPRLQVLTEAMEEPDADELRLLDRLHSRNADWQASLVSKMRAAQPQETSHPVRPSTVVTTPPSKVSSKGAEASPWRWQAIAAVLVAAAGTPLTWYAMKNRPPVIQERVVERQVQAPVRSANAAVVDLFPIGDRDRNAAAADVGTRIPASAELVTFILNGAAAGETAARVVDGSGREAWAGRLKSQNGVYTLALGVDALASRPLVIECGRLKYKIP